MGYYTSYSLSLVNKVDGSEKIIEDLRASCESALYALDENDASYESCKWYDNDEDLITFSRKYPDILFLLKGEGERSGDLWHKYFMNGKMQYCPAIITYEPFNKEKLE